MIRKIFSIYSIIAVILCAAFIASSVFVYAGEGKNYHKEKKYGEYSYQKDEESIFLANFVTDVGTLQQKNIQKAVFFLENAFNTDATFQKDIFGVASSVVLGGELKQDAHILSESLTIQKRVGGDIRAASSNIYIQGNVGGDIIALSEQFEIQEDVTIGGDINIVSTNIVVNGTINGDAILTGDVVTIYGTVRGDLITDAKYVILEESAVINGDVMYRKGKKEKGILIEDGAVVRGELIVSTIWTGKHDKKPSQALKALNTLATFAIFALIALLVYGYRRWNGVLEHVRSKSWHIFGMGLLTFVAIPLIAVILLFIPFIRIFGFMLLFAYAAVLLEGIVITPILLGYAIYNISNKPLQTEKDWWVLALVGTLTLFLLSFIKLVFVAVILSIIVTFGLIVHFITQYFQKD